MADEIKTAVETAPIPEAAASSVPQDVDIPHYSEMLNVKLANEFGNGDLEPVGLFDAVITKRSDTRNAKGKWNYYIKLESYTALHKIQEKRCFVSSDVYYEVGQKVACDLINWRDNTTGKYNLFIVIIPPDGVYSAS